MEVLVKGIKHTSDGDFIKDIETVNEKLIDINEYELKNALP